MESIKFDEMELNNFKVRQAKVEKRKAVLNYLGSIPSLLIWAVAGALSIISIATAVIVFIQLDKTKHDLKKLAELNNSREQFYIEWHYQVTRNNQNEHIKSLYFDYASELIRQHYVKVPSRTQRQMRPDEIYSLLDTIYYYATSNQFATASYPDGLFLPLAFACVESNFYPEVIGDAGERSIYQFMQDTAQKVYADNGKPFVNNFWQSPQESTWLWFNYYRQLSSNFIHTDKEKEVRWTALAYNVGLYRNGMVYYFNQGTTIDRYLNRHPITRGVATYNQEVYKTFIKYKNGFVILQ